jgi:acetylornithine deacetylase/succinyl-diaminopimelate desuccinylase-like protein
MKNNNTYAGIPEYFAKLETASIVLIPVPYDGTSTWQKGADKGPKAFLEASKNMELYDIETNNEVYKEGIYLADAITAIQDYQFPVNHNDLTRTFFKGTGKKADGELGKAMRTFAKYPNNKSAINTLRSSSTYIGTLGTTCVATMLRAGHAENALPQSATATINCRIFPGTGVENTLAQLKQAINNPQIEFSMLGVPTETDPSPLREDVTLALQKAIDIKYPGLEIIPSMSSGGTDGMHFRAAGIPSYGVNGGYGKASDSFAHGLNERILVQSFYDNLAHWYVLLQAIASPE